MPPPTQPLTSITLRGYRRRQVAEQLLKFHTANDPLAPQSSPNARVIRIVCVSDTHNTRPKLPPGDILIHSGDLTENGSFDEVQAGLTWLSSQPFRYKVFIAGNHDVLLDEAFLAKYPERRYGQAQTKEDLDWGSVIYLQDSSVTLELPLDEGNQELHIGGDRTLGNKIEPRSLTIFGSPWTPQYGISAFQYHPSDHSHWSTRLASLDPTPNIIITHGPPRFHLDRRDFHRAGCAYLGEEIARIRPRLVVFGHIHASYGREDVVLDGAQRAYEEVMTGWAGWGTVTWLAALVVWAKLKWLLRGMVRGKERVTTFANASVVGGPNNELRNKPIVIEL
ncbi:Metallo-dependent phosphatase-like protein [Phialemonium atrogriseum]|uniref:Metallo-dependent phosphatase-like protein n=1 Tax=Phialemonium atrogriseum TaxID=1093897 RepID=A0AAJ0C4H5_9PEZI|nr:Metallo-dependent phosphatase-like protein [Phialemonium atrogriseum]KAK1768948.1 Metallo-dependent phosphatase-like protein [Phialemonium atrogriseum]